MTKRSTTSRSSSSRSSSSPKPSNSRASTSRSGSSSSRSRSTNTRSRSTSSRSKAKQLSLWQKMTPDQKLDILGWSLTILSGFTILAMLSTRGAFTEFWVNLLSVTFGWGRFIVPLLLGSVGLWLIVRHFGDKIPTLDPEQIVGIVLGFFVATATFHLIARQVWAGIDLYELADNGLGGGYTGAFLLSTGIGWFGITGALFILIIAWLVVITFTLSISPAELIEFISERRAHRAEETYVEKTTLHAPPPGAEAVVAQPKRQSAIRPPTVLGDIPPESPPDDMDLPEELLDDMDEPAEEAVIKHFRQASKSDGINIPQPKVGIQTWRLPSPADILVVGGSDEIADDYIIEQLHKIQRTLFEFGAPVTVKETNVGPVITQYALSPYVPPEFLKDMIDDINVWAEQELDKIDEEMAQDAGNERYHEKRRQKVEDDRVKKIERAREQAKRKTKVSKILTLADDLALALSAQSVRFQAPIPGKNLIGLEIPNDQSSTVTLRDVMEQEEFNEVNGHLRLPLGHDVTGQAVVSDLRTLPHLLIAGATGAGKSVCINAIIASLLLQNTPDTLKLMLVDPKRVELTQYNGIPHLLTPVIVDVDIVVEALQWATKEMDSRYRRFASIGARNIESYNERAAKSEDHDPIPYIVIIIDELADMMMRAPDETERVICRLAQMARATGIHLIIATQRPSVDVVTGLIKANFPARIAFAVASTIDSRVILDMPGAERLLGSGDMLFMPPDASDPMRSQGAYVSDQELERLIDYWRNAVETDGIKSLPVDAIPSLQHAVTQPPLFPTFDEPKSTSFEITDNIMPAAVEAFLAEDKASTSLLQRKLRIGYTRAARLVEELTDLGVITSERQGQFRKVNRAVAEELLRAIYGDD